MKKGHVKRYCGESILYMEKNLEFQGSSNSTNVFNDEFVKEVDVSMIILDFRFSFLSYVLRIGASII